MTKTAFLAIVLVGCASSEPAHSPETTSINTSTSATVVQPSDPAGDVASVNAPTPVDGAVLSDSQIATIADVANAGEVEQARVALRRGHTAQVKDFAQLMIDHHAEAKRKVELLMASMNAPQDATPTSTSLSNDGSAALTKLESASTIDFDSAYLALQIKEHKQVLDLLDTKLIPMAKSADLKKLLVDFRPKVAEHLKRAEDVQQSLTKG